MYPNHGYPSIIKLFRQKPQAIAYVRGSTYAPTLFGVVRFYQTAPGVIVSAEIRGLPMPEDPCTDPIFGFHIHGGNSCTGNAADPFADAGMHYDPYQCSHPYHAGDLPPLFGAGGHAFSVFLTDRFTVEEILGKTVVIHSHPDDFTTQPAGNAGAKIACGEIIG